MFQATSSISVKICRVALFLLGTTSSLLAQAKPGEKAAPAAQDFTKEAYVIERHYTQIQMESDGLPNGEWTKTPAEQLRQTREVKVSNAKKLSGRAHYSIVFKAGKVDSAAFGGGDDELKPLESELKTAKYPIEFPEDSGAVLEMRVDVKCNSNSGCMAEIMNPVPQNRTSQPQPIVN